MALVQGARVLVTGAFGFIGSNLAVRLQELGVEVLAFGRQHGEDDLASMVAQADAVIHLAGENRPADASAFERVNVGLTQLLCNLLSAQQRRIPLIFSSSAQAEAQNPYGQSKLAAEAASQQLAVESPCPVAIYRLPGIFGKWCKPNYNSVVATFCHNIANDLPIQIHDAGAEVRLVYVDDLVDEFIARLSRGWDGLEWGTVAPEYVVTLGELAQRLNEFKQSRSNLMSGRVGGGLDRALYSTYISYLPAEKFSYALPVYTDERGSFVEMLKTPDSGQFSFFTVHPGVTRGSHYHHTKTEKFLVIRGKASLRFRQLLTGERHELILTADRPQVVDTIPGWVHDITNVGDEEVVVMLWANEIFDRARPDCVPQKV
ncbi:NAD-dependent epimerase/dehydratase family protein [Herbaspirillum chlorophenolicum]|uniref:NAD-dependent epimerase/dehydratase family protein n=1 Tax=Herbaspirillum chlorophenolicum TaxID=211589 RepID=A0ABW8ES78_9BURK